MRASLGTAVPVACVLVVASLAAPRAAFSQSVEDVAALRDYVVASDLQKQFEQAQLSLIATMLQGFRQAFTQSFREAFDGANVSEQAVRDAEALAVEKARSFSQDMKGFLEELMPWEQLVEEILAPLYLEKFTRDELIALTEFLESPLGQKMQETADLTQGTNERMMARYGEQIQKFGAQRIARLRQEVDQELQAMSATSKPAE